MADAMTHVAEAEYLRAFVWRWLRCGEILRMHPSKHPCQVAMIVLSCKRLPEFQRLLTSLEPFVASTWIPRRVLVDNGSGEELIGVAERSGLFTDIIAHPVNIGMGPAMNDALGKFSYEYILFVEDDLVYDFHGPWLGGCLDILRENPVIGIVKLKRKDNWDAYPYRRIGPLKRTHSGVAYHPWLPSPRWTFRWGQRPWYPAGIHNGWSLGPVLFRWCSWKENGPIPLRQGRGQALAAENDYAKTYNVKWLAARPVNLQPFVQPPTPESPGYLDRV